MRVPVLTELVILDLIHRWEHKERPEVEEYVARFPELGPIDKVPAQIIVEECRCRAKAGERYEVSRYRDRFPVQFPLIEKELNDVKTSTVRGGGSGTVAGSVPAAQSGSVPSMGSNADQYEMVSMLGRGVFGEVWLARKRTSGIEKAIKIVTQPADKEAAQRERRALELIKNLRHPYLLATEDFWVADHRLHIVMELADCTLRNRHGAVPRGGPARHPGGRTDRLHPRGRGGARLPARQARRPPRREAGQHPHPERAREGRRLRPRLAAGQDDGGDEDLRGHAGVHGSRRSGARRAVRRATCMRWLSVTPNSARAARRCRASRSTR